MTRAAVLTLEFRSWWLSGTGGGRGRLLDAACHRDADGLPAMPMSQIKGTLRQTAERLAGAGRAGWTGGLVTRLFGGPAEEDGRSVRGAVAFLGDARIPEKDRAGLAGNEACKRRGMLCRPIAATEIDKRGAAADRTLRYVEAAAPVTLAGRLEWAEEEPPGDVDWAALLDAAAAATVAFGKMKADGYGAALARVAPVEEARAAPHAGVATALRAARRVRLRLRQTRPAIFSARAATEGAHATAAAPTGSALLGWAAARYREFDDPFAAFHGGVRFGAAVPVGPDGEACAPMPKLFMAPKHERAGGIGEDRRIGATVRVGHPKPKNNGDDPVQYAEIGKAPFVARTGYAVNPARGQRLRTATTDGRAAEGQLFGYQHLAAENRREFVAALEREGDSVSDNDWARLIGAFAGRTLRLGRARGTSYGGEYECVAEPGAEAPETVPRGAKRLRVLAMSDLALADEYGTPCVEPDRRMLGLPPARFVGADSALSMRRWAPWNAKLQARDVERQVIEAGSVLTFELDKELDEELPARAAIGLWREAGLGQIWIAPPFLAGESGAAPEFEPPGEAQSTEGRAEAGDGSRSALAEWCEAQLRRLRQEERDRD